MPSIFEPGESILNRMFECAGQKITYLRDGKAMAENIPAKLGKTLVRTDDLTSAAVIRFELRDFIIRASDVPGLNEPKRGDEIVLDGRRYMVAAPNGEPCWRWHTRQSHTQIRIHTKYAGEEE